MLLLCTCFRGSLARWSTKPNLHKSARCKLNLQSTVPKTPVNRDFTTLSVISPIQKKQEHVILRFLNMTTRNRSHQVQVRLQGNKPTLPLKNVEPEIRTTRKDIIRFIRLAKDEWLVLAVGVGCLVISSLITMSVPFALGKILDIIFNKEETKETTLKNLKQFSLLLFGVFIVGGLANYGRVYVFNSASLRIVKNLRSKVYRKMLLQESGWFDSKGTGELLNRLVNDTYFVGNSLSQNLSDGLRSAVMIAAGTTMMICTSVKLTLLSTCIVPCLAGGAIIYGRYVRKITRELMDKFAEISKSIEERLSNVRSVKSCCREDEESKAYDNLLLQALDIGYREAKARSLFFGLSGFAGNTIIISVLYYGGTLVLDNSLTIGTLTSFILYAAYSAVSINGLSNFYTELNKGIGASQRLWEILDRKYAIPLNAGIVPKMLPRGEVEFMDVNFSFPSRMDSKVLNNLNLKLEPGKTTAIVGRSGSGKTTFVTLLLRLYDPQEGRILLDGIDLKDLNPKWLRSHIGVVQQEPILFSGTIRDNILYGLNPGTQIDEARFEHVIQETYVKEFTKGLPDGLNTIVGQRGLLLSGGQRQRVAIARALIKNPSIFILDEATSALDSASEELVQEAIEKVSKGRTVLTIAHRLSTIRNADKIVVIENGGVAEQGDYNELISSNTGIFRDLVSKQAFIMNTKAN